MLLPCRDQVNAGGFNTGMPQDVRQFCNIFIDAVINSGKQMAEIVREYLRGFYAGFWAKALHLRPDLTAPYRSSASGEKYLAGGDFLLSGVFQQLSAEFSRQKNGANLSFQGNVINLRRLSIFWNYMGISKICVFSGDQRSGQGARGQRPL